MADTTEQGGEGEMTQTLEVDCPNCLETGKVFSFCKKCDCFIPANLALADDDPESDSPYCDCGAVHSGLEDMGRCEACGKII